MTQDQSSLGHESKGRAALKWNVMLAVQGQSRSVGNRCRNIWKQLLSAAPFWYQGPGDWLLVLRENYDFPTTS